MDPIEHEGKHYAWRYNSRLHYGVFERKTDGATSHLIVGQDATDARRNLNRLKSKTSGSSYPKNAPAFSCVFDSIASDYIHDA